jgi:hypothetical protein
MVDLDIKCPKESTENLKLAEDVSKIAGHRSQYKNQSYF